VLIARGSSRDIIVFSDGDAMNIPVYYGSNGMGSIKTRKLMRKSLACFSGFTKGF
jgi:hypothetical protein